MATILSANSYRIINADDSKAAYLPNSIDGSELHIHSEDKSTSELWRVDQLGNGRYHIYNLARDRFAYVGKSQYLKPGTPVEEISESREWEIVETATRGLYTIAPAGLPLYWGHHKTIITLADDGDDTENQWKFVRA